MHESLPDWVRPGEKAVCITRQWHYIGNQPELVPPKFMQTYTISTAGLDSDFPTMQAWIALVEYDNLYRFGFYNDSTGTPAWAPVARLSSDDEMSRQLLSDLKRYTHTPIPEKVQ